MEKTKIILYYDALTLHDLDTVLHCLKPEEVAEFRRKMRETSSLMRIKDFNSAACFEKAFELGYLSAHIEYPTEEKGGS